MTLPIESEPYIGRSSSFHRSKTFSSKKESKETSLSFQSAGGGSKESRFFFLLQKKVSNDFTLVERPSSSMASSMAILSHFNDLLDSSVRKMNSRRILYRNLKESAPFYLEKVGNGRVVGRYLEGRGESD